MLNVIKYELKARYKTILWVLGILVFINLLVFINTRWISGFQLDDLSVAGQPTKGDVTVRSMAALWIALCFMANVLVIFLGIGWAISIMYRDLYNKTGYLLLTIPRNGYQLTGAKLITGFIEFIIYGTASFLLSCIQIVNIFSFVDRMNLRELWNGIMTHGGGIIFIIIYGFFVAFFTIIILSYFSIAFIRSFLSKNKFGGLLSFLAFIGVSIIVDWLSRMLEKVLPYSFDLGSIIPGTLPEDFGRIAVNYASSIFNLLILVALFIGTSLLIEKKVEI